VLRNDKWGVYSFVNVLKFEGLMFMKFGGYRGFLIVIGLTLANNKGGCINSVLAAS